MEALSLIDHVLNETGKKIEEMARKAVSNHCEGIVICDRQFGVCSKDDYCWHVKLDFGFSKDEKAFCFLFPCPQNTGQFKDQNRSIALCLYKGFLARSNCQATNRVMQEVLDGIVLEFTKALIEKYNFLK